MTTTTNKKRTRTLWTIDTYSEKVRELYPHVYVIPGQEWKGVMSKLWYFCLEHGVYKATPNKVLLRNQGCQCNGCKADKSAVNKSSYHYQNALAFVGKLTADGHLITEHVGYQATPSAKKRGTKGDAKYRYTCARCGNTEAISVGNALKKPGNTPGCVKCAQGRRETINSHLHRKGAEPKPTSFYIADVYYGDYLKLGISNNYERRAAQGNNNNPLFDKDLTPEEHFLAGNEDLSYEHCWFLSEPLPRAWVFAVEQILLRATSHYIPTTPLPKLLIEVLWTGQTELRDWHLNPEAVEKAFHQLIQEIKNLDGDWYQVYCKHINSFKVI
jgi:hypothetical protein